MQIYLNEKIGNPELFTGRKKELISLLKWVENIKHQLSRSTAMVSRRKTGKSALLNRLYNIVFHINDGVIPFYYEIEEQDQYLGHFSEDFFFHFIYQYIAYKTRKKKFLVTMPKHFGFLYEIIQKENLNYLEFYVKSVEVMLAGDATPLWTFVRNLPKTIADAREERIAQFIDEFQYLNRYIYRDKACTQRIKDLAGSYFHTAEYKTSPLLISGSWIGWLTKDLRTMLPGRFRQDYHLENMPEDEAIETIFKYSQLLNIPITPEIAALMFELSEGNPCYISSLFYSNYPQKDFTSENSLRETLEYEVLNDQGDLKTRWLEYIAHAFKEINGTDHDLSKRIVLYLCQNKDREVSRDEIRKQFKLEIPDHELEKRMAGLILSDIVKQGRSVYYYQGIKDHIFDKVFRGRYADEIQLFDPKDITNEYKLLFEHWKSKFHEICGRYGNLKGRFAEYMISNHLKFSAFKNNDFFCKIMQNLPSDFQFVEYQSVWKYTASPYLKKDLEIDIFARAQSDEYSMIGEVKNRLIPFSANEAKKFLQKAHELIKLEGIFKSVVFVYSVKGFTTDAIDYFKENQIAWCTDERWINNH
ncbi:ATPase domain protein, prokaryote domain protein [Candidatus Magnetomorum sp. HK-1]|nr:ATPase domain protein, prokaryote domain protein [Candidatus Magnetomorum sp. HK-1]